MGVAGWFLVGLVVLGAFGSEFRFVVWSGCGVYGGDVVVLGVFLWFSGWVVGIMC